MRFTLLALNAAMAAVGVLIWLLVQHGILGFVLYIPFLAVLSGYALLIRYNRRMWAWSLLTAYLGWWAITIVFGPAAAAQCLTRRLKGMPVEFLDSQAFAEVSSPEASVENARCGIGSCSVPCPFVVVLDFAYRDQSHGVGERCYFTWCPGAIWLGPTRAEWWSESHS